VNLDDVERWMDRYVKAWTSNEPADIESLFTDDVRYYLTPSSDPWVGREAVVNGWLGAKDEPGTWDFRYEPLALAGTLAFVRGWTDYQDAPPKSYDNLWVIQFAHAERCSEFTEWYEKRPTS
jgi:SnoaL-like domain